MVENLSGWGASATPVILDAAAKGTAVLILAAMIVRAGRASAAARHWVWFLALASLLALPVLESALPAWRVLPGWARVIQPGAGGETANVDASKDRGGAVHRAATSDAKSKADPGGVVGSERGSRDEGREAAELTQGEVLRSPAVAVGARSESRGLEGRAGWRWPDVWGWILIVWVAGVCCAALPTLVGSVLLAWRARKARRVVGGAVVELIGELAVELGIGKRVRVLSAPGVMPMTWGLIRARLLIPEEMENWPVGRRRAVVLHELGHVKRGDCRSEWVARVACAAYWFHPLAWMALWRMRVERELACDDLVLRCESNASSYAENLLAVSAGVKHFPWALGPAVPMARCSGLEVRVKSILDEGVNRRALGRWSAAAAALVTLVVVVTLSRMAAARGERPVVAARGDGGSRLSPAMETGGKAATIRVVDEAGKPVEGASLWLLDLVRPAHVMGDAPEARYVKAATGSDREGIGQIKFRSEDWSQLVVVAENYAPRQIAVPALSAERAYEVRLSRGTTVKGTVRREDGRPVAGARVRAARQKQPVDVMSQFYPMATTDREGRFELAHVGAGLYEVRTTVGQSEYVAPAELRVDGGGSSGTLELVARPGVVVKGRFVRSDGGSVGRAPVELSVNMLHGGSREIWSGDDGAFVVYGIQPESKGALTFGKIEGFSARAEWEGKPAGVETGLGELKFEGLAAGVYEGLVVRLYKTAVLRVGLEDEKGKPYGNGGLMAMPGRRASRTEGDGRFVVELPPGVESTVRILGYEMEEMPAPMSFRASEGEVIERTITVRRKVAMGTYEMRGVVVDSEGKAVAGAEVQLENGGLLTYEAITGGWSGGARPSWRGGMLSPAATKTDGEGRFRFERLLAGRSDVWADVGQVKWGYVRNVDSKSDDVRIVLGDAPGKAEFEGVVEDSEGRVVAGAAAYLYGGDHYHPQKLAEGRTDGAGRFVLRPARIPADQFRHVRLVCRDSKGDVQWKTLPKIGAAGVVVRFREPASVEGRLTSTRGEPLAGALVWLYMGHDPDAGYMYFFKDTEAVGPRTTTDSEGRFELAAPGGVELTVYAKHPEYQVAMVSNVKAAGLRTMIGDLQAADGATVEGTVRFADGRPAVGATVSYTSLNGQGSSTRTDDRGAYRLGGLHEGSGHQITAVLGAGPDWEGKLSYPGALHSGDRAGGWDITMEKPRAVGQGNAPAARGPLPAPRPPLRGG